MLHRTTWTAFVSVVAIGAAPACATKKFVRTTVADQVAQVDAKVGTLSEGLEQTGAEGRRTAARVDEVDRTANAAQRSASAAQDAATRAGAAATEAQSQIQGLEDTSRRLLYEVVISEDRGDFKFGAADLPDAAAAMLDDLVALLKEYPKGIYLEIEGHTDSTGPEAFNQVLGLKRAESVKRYLYERHQVPLHKMSVISFGEGQAAAPNTTREGRAQNRRVVVRVLA